jgi:hypothetical protein
MISLSEVTARDLLARCSQDDGGVWHDPGGRLLAPSVLRDAGICAEKQREAWSQFHTRPLTAKAPRARVQPRHHDTGRKREDKHMTEETTHNGPTFSKEKLETYTKGKTGALNNGDAVAGALDEFLSAHDKGDARRSACKDVAEANGIDTATFDHLNNGGFRMAVGNHLRALVRGGKTVKIGKTRIDAEALGVEVAEPKVKVAKAPAPTPKASAPAKKAPAKAPSAAKAAKEKAGAKPAKGARRKG